MCFLLLSSYYSFFRSHFFSPPARPRSLRSPHFSLYLLFSGAPFRCPRSHKENNLLIFALCREPELSVTLELKRVQLPDVGIPTRTSHNLCFCIPKGKIANRIRSGKIGKVYRRGEATKKVNVNLLDTRLMSNSCEHMYLRRTAREAPATRRGARGRNNETFSETNIRFVETKSLFP